MKAFNNYITTRPHLSVYQIYAASGHSLALPKKDLSELMECRELLASYEKSLFIHACLCTNMCVSIDEDDPSFAEKRKRYINILVAEMDIGVALGAKGVVLHFGSSKDPDRGAREMGSLLSSALKELTSTTKKIAKMMSFSIAEVMRRRIILLENSSHEGTKIGWSLKSISDVISHVEPDVRIQIQVCIDTAHTFGAGVFDFGVKGETARFYQEMKKSGLIHRLGCFHFNDVRADVKYGARKDRHAAISKGVMFGETEEKLDRPLSGGSAPRKTNKRLREVKVFVQEARKRGIPLVCEPPGPKKKETEIEKRARSLTPFQVYMMIAEMMGDVIEEV